MIKVIINEKLHKISEKIGGENNELIIYGVIRTGITRTSP